MASSRHLPTTSVDPVARNAVSTLPSVIVFISSYVSGAEYWSEKRLYGWPGISSTRKCIGNHSRLVESYSLQGIGKITAADLKERLAPFNKDITSKDIK